MREVFAKLADDIERDKYIGDPVGFAVDRLGFQPDAWQAALLRSTSPNVIANCSRQVGKSETTAIKALHTAVYMPESLVLMLSPSIRQTRELFSKTSRALRKLQPAEVLTEDNRLSCTLENGSRLVCLPADPDTCRGFSAPRLVIFDEAAYCDNAVFESVRPMLAVSRGQTILLSSPNGRRGFFFKVWTEGGADWERLSITIHDCPRISKEWIERERANTPAHRWSAEYECSFNSANDSLFAYDTVMRAMSSELRPLFTPAELAAIIGGRGATGLA